MKDIIQKEFNMNDLIWLSLSFVFMFIIIPIVMLITVAENSTLPMNVMLWIGTPVLTVASTSLAYWYLKHIIKPSGQLSINNTIRRV
jgi:hypothetical protein